MSDFSKTTRIISTVKAEGYVELALTEAPIKPCGEDEIIIRVEAAPINPSDLGVMFLIANPRHAKASGDAAKPTIRADIKEQFRPMLASRVDMPVPCGNEGAGTVVAAGASPAAQALMGKTVAVMGGGMYSTYRKAKAADCIVFGNDVTPREAASSFVNPLTALGMVSTMRLEGHKAIVHTAAASNLGQMLVKLCAAENVPLINIVRKPEQEKVLRDLGAECVLNSTAADFRQALVAACAKYDATLAFDATGGGELPEVLLGAMEAAAIQNGNAVGRYGSTVLKQVYIYGGLDRSPTTLSRGYGMSWQVGGWLMPNHLARISPEEVQQMRQKVAQEIRGIFASSYSKEVSLNEMLTQEAVDEYGQQATGLKYLVNPSR